MTLDLTDDDVARLTKPQRQERVTELLADSHAIVDEGIERLVGPKHRLMGTVILYSGGNDSTTLAHIFRERATHAAHINTGIGIEQTREFVRKVCDRWELPLIEHGPDEKNSYRTLVLDQGFPGPAHHFKMYQRLKERGLRKVRREFVTDPRRERVMFLAGRRRNESGRRANVPEFERIGSTVWVSPLVRWTKLDMQTYRLMQSDVPVNEVADLIHMSGECLCGSFAKPGELEEVGYWFPEVAKGIAQLEQEVRATGKHAEERCRWGWGAYRTGRRSRSGPLCSSCDSGLTTVVP